MGGIEEKGQNKEENIDPRLHSKVFFFFLVCDPEAVLVMDSARYCALAMFWIYKWIKRIWGCFDDEIVSKGEALGFSISFMFGVLITKQEAIPFFSF